MWSLRLVRCLDDSAAEGSHNGRTICSTVTRRWVATVLFAVVCLTTVIVPASGAAFWLVPGEPQINSLAIYALCAVLVGMSVVVLVLVWHLSRCLGEISQQKREIELLGVTDPSTGLPNE